MGPRGDERELRGDVLVDVEPSRFRRDLVFHPYYVGPGYEDLYAEYQGDKCVDGGCLTEGCFGVAQSVAKKLLQYLKEGAIIYAFR